MPPVKKVTDQPILVETSAFPSYAKFNFDKFNVVQSRVFEFYNQNVNLVVATSTSSGKTCMAEMLMSYQLRECGGKAIYLAPMKALAKEKYEEWTDEKHHFHDLNISLCTGDYRLTPARQQELSKADIIILTSEMLNSRTRNMKSEKNDWLKEVTICVGDEIHLLTVPGRGDHLEVGLMNLTSIGADVRFVLLSATMPNVDQIADWVSYVLTGKETYLLESKFRPCPLGIHYETYDSMGGYQAQEENKVEAALNIIADNPDDKFLIFAHTKTMGQLMKTAMTKAGYEADFHSADLDKNGREKLESRFKDKKGLKYLIATSTLAWGCYDENTWIHTPNSYQMIGDIKVGSAIISLNENNEFETDKVVKIGHKFVDDLYQVVLDDRREANVSENHEFYSKKGENIDYRKIIDLNVGDEIATINFGKNKQIEHHLNNKVEKSRYKLQVSFIRIKSIEKLNKKTKVFDLEVEKNHNFIGNGMISHNCNMPARRVIILGVHRGIEEVGTYDLWQSVGRAGRPGYDPRGDAYILLPENREEKYRNKLKTPENIESRLLDNVGGHYKTLAFHLVSEIHHGKIKNKEDVMTWYERTLAHFQAKAFDDDLIDSTMDLLLKCGAIKEESGTYKVTVVGMVSSMFYYSPFDVADLRRNFMTLFNSHKENDDVALSMSLGNVDSLRMGFVSKAEKEDMGLFATKVIREFGKETFLETAMKGGCAYYAALTGGKTTGLMTTVRTLQWDFPRLIQVLSGLDSMGCKWNKGNFFKELQSRVVYGVNPELVCFVKLPDIGKVRAERLYSLGFRTLKDIVAKPDVVASALNFKADKVLEIVKVAKSLILVS